MTLIIATASVVFFLATARHSGIGDAVEPSINGVQFADESCQFETHFHIIAEEINMDYQLHKYIF